MRIGLDSGFFIKLYQGDEEVVALWEKLTEKDEELVACVLSGYEFFRVLMRRGEPMKELEDFWQTMERACEVIPVNGKTVREAARLESTYHLGGLDSLILAVLLGSGCREIFTTDSRWKPISRSKKVKIRILP